MQVDLEDERFDGMLKADGLDNAIIGIATRPGGPDVLAYDVSKIIQILVERDGMTPDEATEFFSFNIESAYMGEGTPTYLHSMELLG